MTSKNQFFTLIKPFHDTLYDTLHDTHMIHISYTTGFSCQHNAKSVSID